MSNSETESDDSIAPIRRKRKAPVRMDEETESDEDTLTNIETKAPKQAKTKETIEAKKKSLKRKGSKKESTELKPKRSKRMGYDFTGLVKEQDQEDDIFSFKHPSYQLDSTGYQNRSSKIWKSSKQLMNTENFDKYEHGVPNYIRVQAQPSAFPCKKYCDITGLVAKYTHPRTKLMYANHILYPLVSNLDDVTVNTMLELRGAFSKLR